MLTVVSGEGSGHEGGKDGSASLIDEIVREGARRPQTPLSIFKGYGKALTISVRPDTPC